MRLLPFVVLITLTACGADAPPFQPSANLGLSIGPGGVTTSTSVGASNGTVSVGLNL